MNYHDILVLHISFSVLSAITAIVLLFKQDEKKVTILLLISGSLSLLSGVMLLERFGISSLSGIPQWIYYKYVGFLSFLVLPLVLNRFIEKHAMRIFAFYIILLFLLIGVSVYKPL